MSRRSPQRTALCGIFAIGCVSFIPRSSFAEQPLPLLAKPLSASVVVMPPERPLSTPLAGSELPSSRPASLPALYVSFSALQLLDAHSTLRARDRGAREVNQLLSPFSSNRPAMVAVKAATTAFSIYQTERLWKKNRKAAVVTMIAMNSAYAFLVVHNYKVANRLR